MPSSFHIREKKGMTLEKATELCLKNTLFYGTMMVKMGDADGMVSGAIHSTGDMLRPALQIIKTKPGIKTVSSCFLMEMPEQDLRRRRRAWSLRDCAVNIEPDAEQLAAIAIASAQDRPRRSPRHRARASPCSPSPPRAARKHDNVDKVAKATRIASRSIAPELNVDGELQADAALVEKVGQLKCPGSHGRRPGQRAGLPRSLEAGNIGYKLVQRLAGAEAIGPVMQGLAKPVNDLSRGCSVDDIVSLCVADRRAGQGSRLKDITLCASGATGAAELRASSLDHRI